MKHLLDNITWHTLSGVHARFAVGAGGARRYAHGFSPILGFSNPDEPDFKSLRPVCQIGEHFYCGGWSGAAPSDWRIEEESTMFKMVFEGSSLPVEESIAAVRLGPEHATQAMELATLTHPGPFGPRTIELGDYFGCFENGRLIAMAGERMCAGSLREISGVCTHPDFQGRRLASRLMGKLIRLQMQRNETPFLHVMHDNEGAHCLYERLGFRDYKETVVRVVTMQV